MPNYQNGQIYKIWSPSSDATYYGSTTQKLSSRMAEHRSTSAKVRGNTLSREVIAHGDAVIVLVENYPCDSKYELCAREAHFIKNFDCVNKQIPGRTHKQWHIDNAESVKIQKQQYNQDNKVKIKADHRIWHAENVEHVRTQTKEYRELNKAKLTAPFNCDCGGKYQHKSKVRHFKTKKHIDYFNHDMRALFR